MSRLELENKIVELIKAMPDKTLQNTLEIIENLNNKSDPFKLMENVDKVIEEDRNLLKRLAQ